MAKVAEVEERVDNLEEGMRDMSMDVDIVRQEAHKNREAITDLQVRSRQNNLLFAGFPENK